MKKLILLIIILATIEGGCKLTGNFAIVKRQHGNGYYIQTPSFVRNNNKESTKVNFHQLFAPSLKGEVDENQPPFRTRDNADFQLTKTDINATPLAKAEQAAKTIKQTIVNEAPQYTLKPIAKDTIKKKSSGDTLKTTDNRKTDWASLTAFLLGCLTYLEIPLDAFFTLLFGIDASFFVTMACFLLYPVGIILGIIGLHRIHKRPDKLKGKRKAIWAFIMPPLFYLAIALLWATEDLETLIFVLLGLILLCSLIYALNEKKK